MKQAKLIGSRAFYKKLFRVMTPVLIQNIITNFVSLLDNLMVGQIGTEPMSGVAIVNQLLFVFNLCIFGGLAGAGIFTAQFYGSGDQEGVRHTFRLKLWVGAASVGLFLVIFLGAGDRLISLFLHDGEEGLSLEATLDYGRRYLAVMLFEMLPFALSQVYASTLRECGETVLPMKAGIAAVFINMVFNYILIFGKLGLPALGVSGAAAATVLARVVECAIVIFWAHRHSERCPYAVGLYRSLRVPWPLVKRIAVMGLPLLLNELLWSAGMALLNQCFSLRGLEVVSAVNISSTVSNLFMCGVFAMGSTIAIIVGQLLGAGKLERAVAEDRQLTAFAVAMCVVVGAVMALVAPLIPELYNTTPAVKALAADFLLIMSALLPFISYTNACYFTLRSGGKTIITFIFDSAFVWVINIPAAMFLSRATSMPIVPMYAIVQSLELVKCTIGFFMVRSRKWVNNLTVA
ncbi:MAG: MATE family efflux transporter [Oscillospiraceae bacterium]|nr:MATE family efflux transporter [Oscillospiraceae bacterium]